MAEVLNIGGQEFKKRNPVGIWALSAFVPFYGWVWYYKVNDEARRYLGDESIKPGLAVLAIALGWVLLFIPPYVSIFRTGKRIERMQAKAGVSGGVSPGLGLVMSFAGFGFIFTGFGLAHGYYQENLNRVWTRYSSTPAPGGPAAGQFTA